MWLGSWADPRPSESLQIAAVLMCGESHESPAFDAYAQEAARCVVALAVGDERDALREFLTPDPQTTQVTYTVSCYSTGDVVATHIRDYSSPASAVCALVSCDDPAHETAELLASSRTGIRWSALRRRGRDVVLQLPTPSTIEGPTRVEAAIGAARRRWRGRLASWAVAQGVLDDEPGTPAAARTPERGDASALWTRIASLEEAVERLSRQVRDLTVEERSADVFAQLLDDSDDAFWSTPLIPHAGTR